MRSRAAVALLILLATAAAAAQRQGAPATADVPPLSMTCPMHPDVVESRAGACPLCKMALVPVRLDTAWMCPVHTTVMGDAEGTCRICKRNLVRVRVAVTWTCLAQPGIERLEPGTCADGSAMVRRQTLRPHGNHNPQHGGQFFMAPDNWHHLEGTYPRDRVFRLYIYDDYARPLAAADLGRVRARVVTRETFDPATRTSKELAAFPLRPSRDGAYLEARLDGVTLPAEMTAKVRIKPDAPEYRFDFSFNGVTREPAATPSAATRAAPRSPVSPSSAGAKPQPDAAPARPAASRDTGSTTAAPAAATATAREARDAAAPAAGNAAAPVDAPAAGNATTPVAGDAAPAAGDLAADANADPAMAPLVIPDAIGAIVRELRRRDEFIRSFIEQGNFAAVWVPAFHAKDLAVALEPHLAHLSPADRALAGPALQEVVRLAWLLDAFGDVGNRQQLEAGHAAFSRAVAAVSDAFAGVP